MLHITRHVGESVEISYEDSTMLVYVTEIKGKQIRLAFAASPGFKISRKGGPHEPEGNPAPGAGVRGT